jgi:hypothetical protein
MTRESHVHEGAFTEFNRVGNDFLNRQNAKHAARAAKGNAQKDIICAHDVRNVLFGGARSAHCVLAVHNSRSCGFAKITKLCILMNMP